jgi:transcriptional regulator with XRE-family HTH domain
MPKTLVEEYVEKNEHMRLYQQERAIYEVAESLESAMKKAGVDRAELAKRLGKTHGWVARLLDGEGDGGGNQTIREIAEAFAVLGYEYRSFYRQIQISNGRQAKHPHE